MTTRFECALKAGPGGCSHCGNPNGHVTETVHGSFLTCTCGTRYARFPDPTVSVSVTGNVDTFGRRTFFIDWHEANGRIRAQHFRANLNDHTTWEGRPVHVAYAPGVIP